MPTRTISSIDFLPPYELRTPRFPYIHLPWNKWQQRAIYLIDPCAYVSVNARAGDSGGRSRLGWIYGIL